MFGSISARAALVPKAPPKPAARPTDRCLSASPASGASWCCFRSGAAGARNSSRVEEFDKAGYHVDFCTPTGKRPNSIKVSQDAAYVDPPLGRTVTTPEMAAKATAWDDPATPQGRRLDAPRSLGKWFPARPVFFRP